MANVPFKSITFPGLSNTYIVPEIDATLEIAGKAADAKKTGDEIRTIKADLEALGDGVPTEVRQAMLALFNSAAYAETGLTDEVAVIASWAAVVTSISLNQSSISISGASTSQLVATTTPAGGAVTWASSDTSVATVSSSGLVTGIGNGSCTITASSGGKNATCSVTVSGFATLSSISAAYTQGGTVYDTDTLNSLKTDLVVTAHYDNSTTATVASTDYTLSGTLAVGTSTITVTYGGKTTTFNVLVSLPTIRVFVGKGVSGASIVDNANRALSEPIPFTNVAPITFEYVDFSATKCAFKNTTSNTSTIDTNQYGALEPSSYIGTSSTTTGGWANSSEEWVIARKSGVWEAVTFSSSSGYFRILFANNSDPSSPISETISGKVIIQGQEYQLIEEDVSEFE